MLAGSRRCGCRGPDAATQQETTEVERSRQGFVATPGGFRDRVGRWGFSHTAGSGLPHPGLDRNGGANNEEEKA